MENTYTPQIWRKQETILVKLPYSDFDFNASEHFRPMVINLISKFNCKYLVLDFSNVVLIDGVGLAAIVFCLHTCVDKDIKLLVCSLKNNLLDIINKKGLTSMLEVFNSFHEALDMVTYYSNLDQKHHKTSKDIESVFGNISEEDINYT